MSFFVNENASLAPYSSMKVGGNAKYLVFPKSDTELVEAIGFFREKNEKIIVVGNCSNLIFTDLGFDGAVISTTSLRGVSIKNQIITAYCGETLSTLARFACENSLSGLEFCYGIPGTVGGGVYMNAGAYGGELSDRFIDATFIDENLNLITLTLDEMEFGYRTSRLQNEKLILVSASFSGIEGNKAEIRAKMD